METLTLGAGLNPRPARFVKFLAILTLESFSSAALGLTVGSFAPSTEAAVAIGPAVMVVFIVFGGYYVNASNVPLALRWLPQASLIKQAFQALCVNEFKGGWAYLGDWGTPHPAHAHSAWVTNDCHCRN